MYSITLFISGGEIFIILLVVLLLFGANKLPEIARGLGKGYQEFKKATNDIRSEFNEHTKDIKKEANNLKQDIEDYTEFEEKEDPFKDVNKTDTKKDNESSTENPAADTPHDKE
ncbi:MAG: twin-arginine translocase TatA/TatE family subunit [Bacteroidales bacterium]